MSHIPDSTEQLVRPLPPKPRRYFAKIVFLFGFLGEIYLALFGLAKYLEVTSYPQFKFIYSLLGLGRVMGRWDVSLANDGFFAYTMHLFRIFFIGLPTLRLFCFLCFIFSFLHLIVLLTSKIVNSYQEDQRPSGAGCSGGAEAPVANPGSVFATSFFGDEFEFLFVFVAINIEGPTGFDAGEDGDETVGDAIGLGDGSDVIFFSEGRGIDIANGSVFVFGTKEGSEEEFFGLGLSVVTEIFEEATGECSLDVRLIFLYKVVHGVFSKSEICVDNKL